MATIRINLRQTTQPASGGIALAQSVPEATGIDPAVFVFTVSTDRFSRYATLSDMLLLPGDKTLAQNAGLSFYRAAAYTTIIESLDAVTAAKSSAQTRVQQLVNDWLASGGTLTSDVTKVIVPGV